MRAAVSALLAPLLALAGCDLLYDDFTACDGSGATSAECYSLRCYEASDESDERCLEQPSQAQLDCFGAADGAYDACPIEDFTGQGNTPVQGGADAATPGGDGATPGDSGPGEDASCGADDECASGVCTAQGECKQCTAEKLTQCEGTATPLCNSAGNCVQCLEAGDCSAEAAVCSDGACTACDEDADCASHADSPACVNGACEACSATNDARCLSDSLVCKVATSSCVDCLDASQCSADAPVCGTDDECTDCTVRSDCEARYPDTPACGDGSCVECVPGQDEAACDGATPVCKTGGNECVQCNENADCGDPTRALCADNLCVPCTVDAHCASQGEADVCDAGVCVDCRLDPLTESDGTYDAIENSKRELGCAGNVSCDPATLTCTATERGSVGACGACVSDSECAAAHRCIEMFFDSTSQGGRCMRVASEGCSPPYGTGVTRTSASGAAEADYCGLIEDSVSCDAVLGLFDDQQCPTGGDSECGTGGALCRTVGVLSNRCTYACSGAAQCPDFAGCGGGGGVAEDWCGGD